MKVLTLRVRPLEPLMLRGPGEFDPTSRGVFSYASSLPIPRPSTILGALVSTAIAKGAAEACQPRKWGELLKCYDSVLSSLGVEAIRGPYLYNTHKNRVYVPVLLGGELVIVEYDQAKKLLLECSGGVVSRYLSGERGRDLLEKLKEAAERLRAAEGKLEVKVSRKVGIGLMARAADRPAKVVRRGLIYEAWFIPYPPGVEVRAKLIVRDSSALAGMKAPVRFGGEQRVALMTVEDARDMFDKLLDAARKAGFGHAVLLSPLPLSAKDVERIKYLGRYDTVGFGYSEARGRRKPIHAALLEGTIVRVEGGRQANTLRYGLYGALGLKSALYEALGRMGYASFAPL